MRHPLSTFDIGGFNIWTSLSASISSDNRELIVVLGDHIRGADLDRVGAVDYGWDVVWWSANRANGELPEPRFRSSRGGDSTYRFVEFRRQSPTNPQTATMVIERVDGADMTEADATNFAISGLSRFQVWYGLPQDYEEVAVEIKVADPPVLGFLPDIPFATPNISDSIIRAKLNRLKSSVPVIARFNFPLTQKSEEACLLYTSPSPRDRQKSRMPSSA